MCVTGLLQSFPTLFYRRLLNRGPSVPLIILLLIHLFNRDVCSNNLNTTTPLLRRFRRDFSKRATQKGSFAQNCEIRFSNEWESLSWKAHLKAASRRDQDAPSFLHLQERRFHILTGQPVPVHQLIGISPHTSHFQLSSFIYNLVFHNFPALGKRRI